MARGRKAVQVDTNELQEQIKQLEIANKFENRTQLWTALEVTSWAKNQIPVPLRGQMAMLKAKEFNLIISTPVGRRGQLKGYKPTGGGRKKRVLSTVSVQAVTSTVPNDQRKKLEKTLSKLATGSMRAAVKLKCLDCTNWCPGEVALCEMQDCSLWNFRPYKRTSIVKELL